MDIGEEERRRASERLKQGFRQAMRADVHQKSAKRLDTYKVTQTDQKQHVLRQKARSHYEKNKNMWVAQEMTKQMLKKIRMHPVLRPKGVSGMQMNDFRRLAENKVKQRLQIRLQKINRISDRMQAKQLSEAQKIEKRRR